MSTFYILILLVAVYLFMNKYFVRRLMKKGPIGNSTLLVLVFVAGVAIGDAKFHPAVVIPLLLAFAVYHWPRLKAFFLAIGNH